MDVRWTDDRYQTVYPLGAGGRRTSCTTQRAMEHLRVQLESCKQKNEELEMRALAAEMEATHQNLEMNGLQEKLAHREATIGQLQKDLEESRTNVSSSEKNLARFQRKINRLRVALTKEIEKIKQSEGEARSNFNLLFHSALQYKNEEISKEEFFSTISNMESMYIPPVSYSPSVSAAQPSTAPENVQSDENPQGSSTQLPAHGDSLQPSEETSHIHSLVGMLSEQGMAVSTDDEMLEDTRKPMPLKQRLLRRKTELNISSAISEDSKVSNSVPSVGDKENESTENLHPTSGESTSESKGSNLHPSLEENKVESKVDLSPSQVGESKGKGLVLRLAVDENENKGMDSNVSQDENGDESKGQNSRYVLKRSGGSLRSIEYFPFMGKKRGSSDSDNSDFEMFIPPKRKLVPSSTALEHNNEPEESASVIPTPETISENYHHVTTPVEVPPPLPPKNATSPDSKRATFGKKSVSSVSSYYESIGREDSRYETMLDLEPVREKSHSIIHDTSDGEGHARRESFNHSLRKKSVSKRTSDPTNPPLPPFPRLPPLDSQQGDEEHNYDTDDSIGCTYLDPNELESQPIRRPSVEKVEEIKEEDSLYLTLVQARKEEASRPERPSKQSMSTIDMRHRGQAKTISSSRLNIGKGTETWKADSAASGYSTDSSSDHDRDSERLARRRKVKSSFGHGEEHISSMDFSSYVKSNTKPALRRRRTSESCPGDFADIYTEIDNYDVQADDRDEYVTFVRESHSPSHNARPSAEAPSTSLPPIPPKTLDDVYESMYHDGEGMLNEIPEQGPPSLPPRPPKRLESKEPRDDKSRVVRRYPSVPLDQLEHVDEERDSSKSPVPHMSPLHVHRPAVHGGSHTLSPLTVQTTGQVGSQGDLASMHAAESGRMQDLMNIAKKAKASTLPLTMQGYEKSGFLKKMDPKMKNWNRRWFVLKGVELKYFKTNKKSQKGVIYLDRWCKLDRGFTPDTFQLETHKKVYYLGCNTEKERNEWVEAIEVNMQLHQPQGASLMEERLDGFVQISGYAQVKLHGQTQRLWCVLKGSVLSVSQAPNSVTLHQVQVSESVVRKRHNWIMIDSVSSSDFLSVLYTVQGSLGLTEIQPMDQSNQDSWYYYLCSIHVGDIDQQITNTEKLLAEIEQSRTPHNNKLWSHPVFNFITGTLQQSLTTLTSAPLNELAKALFQNIQAFIHNQVAENHSNDYSFHVLLVQDIVGACLEHPSLQDEAYCQILRQITGHQSATSIQVSHGWLLLSVFLSSFLPIRPRILWYLRTFITQQCSSHWPAMAGYASCCQDILSSALDLGQRRRKPSFLELTGMLEKFSESGTTLVHEISIPVHLEDGSTVDVEFNPFTTIKDLVTLVNSRTDLPDTSLTGFGLFCDWPGLESLVCCCSFLETKVVDLIAVWFAALDKLNGAGPTMEKPFKYQRTIQLVYKKCLFLRQHNGSESSKEVILLAYQISKYIHSGECQVPSVEKAVSMAALLSQMEYGDWNTVKQQGEAEEDVCRDAVLMFCPWKMTHLALDHDLMSLQKKLEDHWKVLVGMNREDCARRYVGVAQEWNRYGITSFHAEEYNTSNGPQRPVQLTISDKGVSIFNKVGTTLLSNYDYQEITAFGGTTDDKFMFMVSSQERRSSAERNGSPINKRTSPSKGAVEKLTFVMPKLKVCEASYLMDSYIRMNNIPPRAQLSDV